MRRYTVKENNIGSAVSEILSFKQTNIQTSCYFIIRIIYFQWRTSHVSSSNSVMHHKMRRKPTTATDDSLPSIEDEDINNVIGSRES